MTGRLPPISVLITGVGDTVGQAMIKAARASTIPCRVVGTDRTAPSVGFAWADAAYVLPHCSDEDAYLAGLLRVVADEAVRLILPGSESELALLARHRAALEGATGARVVASSMEVLEIALDKWETCRFLERAGLRFPRYARLDAPAEVDALVADVGFPLVAKPRRGTGSRGLARVASWKDLDHLRDTAVNVVLEETLEPADQEYSVGVYVPRDGRPVDVIAYRRDQMVAGDTYRARIARHAAAEAEARRIAEALRPRGPCDVQLRVTGRGPVTFEINARCAGGAAIRAHHGYNEVEMAIRDLVLEEPLAHRQLSSGTVVRYWEEMYFADREGNARDGTAP